MKVPAMTKQIIVTALVTLCCLTLPFVAAPEAAVKKELRVAYQPFTTPAGALLEVMKRDLLLKQELERIGIALKFSLINKGSDAFEGLKNKTIHITTMGEMPLLEAASVTPLVVIGQHKQNFASVVTQRGIPAKELKGKRIGNAFATSGHLALLKTLKKAGLGEREIVLVQMNVSDMPDALLKGSIDAFAAWEPTSSSFIARYPDRFSSIGRHTNSAYLLLERATTINHPKLAALLAASMARAINWMTKDNTHLLKAASWNREAMQSLTGKPAAISVNELSRQIASDLQGINNNARLPAQAAGQTGQLAEAFEFLKSIGRLPQTVQWDQMRTIFNHNVMNQVYRHPASSGISRFDYAP